MVRSIRAYSLEAQQVGSLAQQVALRASRELGEEIEAHTFYDHMMRNHCVEFHFSQTHRRCSVEVPDEMVSDRYSTDGAVVHSYMLRCVMSAMTPMTSTTVPRHVPRVEETSYAPEPSPTPEPQDASGPQEGTDPPRRRKVFLRRAGALLSLASPAVDR